MDKMAALLRELTEIQLNIHALTYELVDLLADDPQAVNKSTTIRHLASLGGLLTDRCRDQCGSDTYYEELTDWILPPALRSAG